MRVINSLESIGCDVYPTTEKCDRAIILGGKHENPTVFDCERILIYHEQEWSGLWEFFEPIITEYYDKMIDVAKLSLQETVKKIIKQCSQ
jgi:hypothetical protein